MELNRLKVRQEKMELEELEENQLTYFEDTHFCIINSIFMYILVSTFLLHF